MQIETKDEDSVKRVKKPYRRTLNFSRCADTSTSTTFLLCLNFCASGGLFGRRHHHGC